QCLPRTRLANRTWHSLRRRTRGLYCERSLYRCARGGVMPVTTDILAPVTALLLLTCVVWAWMYATRIPAIRKAGMKLDPDLPKGQQMSELPPRVRWKA